jgi:hypothetical protein
MVVQPISKIADILGKPQPKPENILIDSNGVVIVTEGELDLNKLVKKALNL